MPHIHQRKYHLHKVKRLHHNYRHDEHLMINNLPANLLNENLFDKTSRYVKYFDYPLAQLLVDHSTDPSQNTTRQYIDKPTNNSNEGRFVNHEMIIRRNGETTILRPKQDFVLANGFTPVIRPSSILPSYQSLTSDSQPVVSSSSSSLSIMNKMSMKKFEQTSIIKPQRKNRHRRKRCNEQFIEQNHFSNEFHHQNNSSESHFIHLVEQALHNMIEEKKMAATLLPPQPVPLMSILPQFPSPHNQSNPSRIEDRFYPRSPCFNDQSYPPPLISIPSHNRYTESFYDLPHEQYRSFEQVRSPPLPPPLFQDHLCSHSSMSHQRNYSHMSGYFFN